MIRMSSIVVNTTNVDTLADFWSALLELEIAHRSGEWFLVLQPQQEHGVSLAFQKVDDPTEGRRRLHVDLDVPDLDEAEQRVTVLGGKRVEEHTIGDFTWRVMADPDGNEFCMATH